jgi:mannose-6-phosphate isomerase-like protein (cupin superfamily)
MTQPHCDERESKNLQRNPSRFVYSRTETAVIEKHEVRMNIYSGAADCPLGAVVYQETVTGHSEEFIHERSAFIYYIIEGTGVWVIEDVEYSVQAMDVVIVPPGKRFYFRGNLKQVLVTAPAWEEKYERHVRNIS